MEKRSNEYPTCTMSIKTTSGTTQHFLRFFLGKYRFFSYICRRYFIHPKTQQYMNRLNFVLICIAAFLLTACSHAYTIAEANSIIVILIIIVIALIVMGAYSLHYNRIITRRNEQMQRILTALNDYRSLIGNEVLSLDDPEEVLKKKLQRPKKAKAVKKDEKLNFFVTMDARVNKERPFTDPDFDQDALIKFMGVSNETFCELVPRYKDPDRTLDYINSLRAEYAAELLMEKSDYPVEDIARMCGFRNTAAYNSAFKFAFGITPAEYLSSMSQMFKKKE